MEDQQFISKEMVASGLNELKGDGTGVQAWCDKYLGQFDDGDEIEAFEDFYRHTLFMVAMGADPITTATASFMLGFEVARRFFNDAASS